MKVLFSEMDAAASLISVDLPGIEEKDGLPMEAFAKVQEIFSNVDWLDPKTDLALNVLQQISASNVLQGKLDSASAQISEIGNAVPESIAKQVKAESKASEGSIDNPNSTSQGKQSRPQIEPSLDANLIRKKMESQELQDTNSVGKKSVIKDKRTTKTKTEMQELQIALQRPSQPKIISQRVPQTSLSSPVSYSNSLQGSPVPMSRYHSAPSALGITALLHDHATSNKEEELTHPVTLGPSSTLPKLVKPDSTFIPTPPPLPSLPSLQTTKTTHPEITLHDTCEPTSVPHPSPHSTVLKASPYSAIKGSSLSLEASRSSSVKNIISTPPPPPPPLPSHRESPSLVKNSSTPPPPTPPPFPGRSPSSNLKSSFSAPPPPPLPPPSVTPKTSFSNPPPPPPPPPASVPCPDLSLLPSKSTTIKSRPPPPPPPPKALGTNSGSTTSAVPPPPPPPNSASRDSLSKKHANPPVPPPPAPLINGVSKAGTASPQSHSAVSNGNVPSIPGPPSSIPLSGKGRGLSRPSPRNQAQSKKTNLKPYHWLKLTRAMQGSLWAEAQKTDEASK